MPTGGTSAEAVTLTVTSSDLSKLYADLKGVEGNLRVELRHGVVAGMKPMQAAVKSAASFSTRIPGSIKTKTSFSARKASVAIFADPNIAPEAAPINNKGKGGTFRHPVYGNRDVWVSEKARPFFTEPIRAHLPDAERAILAAMDTVARKAGFR